MGLHELTLRNFRLFTELSFRPDAEAVTVLISENGTGKTSVLEAVHALATASSFRTTTAVDMIKNGETVAEAHGILFQQQRRIQIDLTLTRGVRNTTKRILVNNQRPQTRAELSAVLPLTVFTPEGVDIVREGPENRRRFTDTLLTDVDLGTGEGIERFERILQQRNAVLKSWQGNHPTSLQRQELDVWTDDFCLASATLLEFREKLLVELAPLVEHYYQALAHDQAPVRVVYERSWEGDLRDVLRAKFDEERYRGRTSAGPHRDDVALFLDGRDARRQASQGEQRSLALALRLAGHELVKQHRSIDPLLLLDDVFSELDPLRSDRLLQLLPVGQTLVTTASPLPGALNPATVIDLTKGAQ